eukprot:1196149-Prorocentrum_minimum.AAC.8
MVKGQRSIAAGQPLYSTRQQLELEHTSLRLQGTILVFSPTRGGDVTRASVLPTAREPESFHLGSSRY